MTATTTEVLQKTVISEREWVKIFPKHVVENYTSSATFVKQLTLAAISLITFTKNAFSGDCFTTTTFGGIQLPLLKHKCSDDLAQFVATALQQAWEAFDKKYVYQLALCFYENGCQQENLFEYHIFEYSYNSEGVSLNINSKSRNGGERRSEITLENVKMMTSMWMRMLTVYTLQNCATQLPLNYDISLRLYYNDNAPEGYQAPGFFSQKEPDHLEPTLPETLKLGSVETPYHKVTAWAYARGMLGASDEAEPSANMPAMTQDDYQDNQGSSIAEASDNCVDIQLRCPCNRHDVPADPAALLTCQYCLTQQHAVCFGFTTSAPAAHCCAACYDTDPSRRASDAKLCALDLKRRECLCLCRRTLQLCSTVKTMDGQMLVDTFGISSNSATRMIKLLKSHCIVPNTSEEDLTTPRKINYIRLKLAFKRFFLPEQIEEDTIVSRLMDETAAAQETSDPIADVLSPLEKVTLHNTSNLGQVIENHTVINRRTRSDDKILQEYRDAVLTNNNVDEELPLSGSHNPVQNIENIGKKRLKRKNDSDDEWIPKLRSGYKTRKTRMS